MSEVIPSDALNALRTRRDVSPLRRWLDSVDLNDAVIDEALGRWWSSAAATDRVLAGRVCAEDRELGARWVSAMLDHLASCPLEGALTNDQYRDFNASLGALRSARTLTLSPDQWRVVGRLARHQRSAPVPELDAAQLLAERAPTSAGPSVALTAFRPGPEDAEDRLISLADPGRFTSLTERRGWIVDVLAAGAAGLEAIASLSRWAVTAAAADDAEGLSAYVEALQAHLRRPVTDGVGDAWVRWQALDALSRAAPQQARPWLLGALEADEYGDAPWFTVQVKARLQLLGPDQDHQPVKMPPLPDMTQRIASRCQRIARQAAVVSNEDPAYAAALQQRAVVEAHLVGRGQLMASFLVPDELSPMELEPRFQPWSEMLSAQQRADLQRLEDAWLD